MFHAKCLLWLSSDKTLSLAEPTEPSLGGQIEHQIVPE